MNFIIWLIVGGIVGWLASLVMRTDAQQGVLLNVIVGIVGAFLGGLLATTLGFGGSAGLLGTIVVAFIGAAVMLALVYSLRPGARPRKLWR